jgi:hypothetical protein
VQGHEPCPRAGSGSSGTGRRRSQWPWRRGAAGGGGGEGSASSKGLWWCWRGRRRGASEQVRCGHPFFLIPSPQPAGRRPACLPRTYGCKRGGSRLPASRPHTPQAITWAVAAARIAPQAFAGFAATRACRRDREIDVRASKLAEPPACGGVARRFG